MSCDCNKKPISPANCRLPRVIQINQKECPVLFYTVEVDGTDEDNPPAIGQYQNVLLVFKGNGAKYLFSSDGIPSLLTSNTTAIQFNNILGRPKYAGELMSTNTNIPDVQAEITAREEAVSTLSTQLQAETTAREDADTILDDRLSQTSALAETAVQPSDLDVTVTSSVSLDSTPSTSLVQLSTGQINLQTKQTTETTIPLPVASSTAAGVMNTATFNAITENTNNITALMNGAVAVSGLSAAPTTQELTSAWLQGTGLSALMNRASIYDTDNEVVWTYYANTGNWYSSENTSTVTINPFTNTSAGTIKGSTNVGQIFAENDGTGSVNGWDSLSANVTTNTSKLSTVETGAQKNVQADYTETDTTSDAFIKNKPTDLGDFTNNAGYIKTPIGGTVTLRDNGTFVASSTFITAIARGFPVSVAYSSSPLETHIATVTQINASTATIWWQEASAYDSISQATLDLANHTYTTTTTVAVSGNTNGKATGDSIEWSSVQSAPIAVARRITSIGHGLTNATFLRTGNLVNYSLPDVTTNDTLPDGRTVLGETLPSGYRPSSRIYGVNGIWVPTVTIDGAAPNRNLGFRFQPDGTMILQIAGGSIPGLTRYAANATWWTDDDYPTGDVVQ